MRSQLLAARLALAALVLAALAAAGAIIGVRGHFLTYDAGLDVMTQATILGLAALGAALVWMLKALIRNDGAGRRIGLTALIGSLLLVYMPLQHAVRGWKSPAIFDASSDPEDPPRFVALAARAPGMNPAAYDSGLRVHYKGETNTVAYMLHTYYMDLTKPYAKLLMTKQRMFWHAFETAKKLGWNIVAYNEGQGRIEATDTGFWFGQTAAIVIRVQTAGTIGARVDVRSQNEVGKRDFGANLERLKQFFAAFHGNGY